MLEIYSLAPSRRSFLQRDSHLSDIFVTENGIVDAKYFYLLPHVKNSDSPYKFQISKLKHSQNISHEIVIVIWSYPHQTFLKNGRN